jgi:phage gp16-like protein
MERPDQNDRRYELYKLLNVARATLRMADEDYRYLLARHGATERDGKISATTMDIPSLSAALDEMRKKGFTPQGKTLANAADWRKPRIAKITAIWCALADAGVIKNRGEASMIKFCARITGKPRLEWAQAKDLSACIQALRAWAKNSGVTLEE